jgi:hypothetical protein
MEVMCVDFEATTTREAIAARENNATTSAAIEAHMISTTTVAVTATNTALTLNRRHLEKYIRIISMPRLLPNSRTLAGYQEHDASLSEESTLPSALVPVTPKHLYMSPMYCIR